MGCSALSLQAAGQGYANVYFQVKKQFNTIKLSPITKSSTFLVLVI